MKKVLIIEDELLSALRLKQMILDIDDTIDIQGPLTNVDEVIKYLRTHHDYDLIFSDIRLADGDVFTAFQEVRPVSFVIFTTAYDEYAIKAFKHQGVDYLLKPIDERELRQALQKTILLNKNHKKPVQITENTVRYKERLIVYKGEDIWSLQVSEILYFVTKGRDLECITENGEKYRIPTSIQKLEEQLDPNIFFRLNRQYLINIKALKRITSFFNSKLKVKLQKCEDDAILVSKECAILFKKWLDQ